MSKILKASYAVVETENVYSLEVPKVSTLKLKREYEARQEKKKEEDEVKHKNPDDMVKDARKEATEIIKNSEEEAYNILSEAKAKAELNKQEIFETAKTEGYNDGYNEGYSKGCDESERIKADAEKIYNDTLAEREEILEALEPQAVELILKVADKILGCMYDMNPKVVLNLIRQGLANSNIAGEIQIHVSPEDYDTVLKNKEELIEVTDGTVSFDIIKDFSLDKSDCIIETPFGDIDCSLGQQFENLKNSLYYICENR